MSLDAHPSAEWLLARKRELEERAGQPVRVERAAPLATQPVIATGALRATVPPDVRQFTLERAEPLAVPRAPAVRLRIPWSHLVSDNAKQRPAIKWVHNEPRANVLLTAEYRRCRDAIKRLAVKAMDGRPAFAVPLALEAHVFVPDNRARDVVNFSKALHDALQGVVYVDDRWLYAVQWIRAGVDVDAPRCELCVRPLVAPPSASTFRSLP